MSHTHAHPETLGKRLLVSMLINLIIPALQIWGGIVAGSVALISDAVHNLGDFTALLIAYGANKAGKRRPSLRHTFGLQRLEIFAAVINAALLGGAAIFIAAAAITRLMHPKPVGAALVAILALVGVLGNGASAILLHKDSAHNLNARGAFLHMVGDLLTSVAVLMGALIMKVAGISWLDPILSLAIVVYILVNCILLLKEAVHVLLNGTPRGLNLEEVRDEMEAVEGISGVHYLHAWSMGDHSVALTCHVVVPDQRVSALEALSDAIRTRLRERFDIDHPVLQFETRPCGEGTLLCEETCNAGTQCHGHTWA